MKFNTTVRCWVEIRGATTLGIGYKAGEVSQLAVLIRTQTRSVPKQRKDTAKNLQVQKIK